MAKDPTSSPNIQIQAMGRYQTLVRQLALVARHAEPQTSAAPPRQQKNPVVQRSGGDPRRLLQAVK